MLDECLNGIGPVHERKRILAVKGEGKPDTAVAGITVTFVRYLHQSLTYLSHREGNDATFAESSRSSGHGVTIHLELLDMWFVKRDRRSQSVLSSLSSLLVAPTDLSDSCRL